MSNKLTELEYYKDLTDEEISFIDGMTLYLSLCNIGLNHFPKKSFYTVSMISRIILLMILNINF